MNINDARVRYTEMIIRERFLDLLRVKSYQLITVTELCRSCNINRATFYKHYKDIQDLLSSIEQDTIDELANTIDVASFDELRSKVLEILQEIKDRKNAVVVLSSENGRPGFAARLLTARYANAYPLLERRLGHMDPAEQEMLFCYMTAGSGAIIQYWMQNGMKEPLDTIADLMLDTGIALTDKSVYRKL